MGFRRYNNIKPICQKFTSPVKVSAFARRLHVIYTPAHRLQHGCTVENACTTPVTAVSYTHLTLPTNREV